MTFEEKAKFISKLLETFEVISKEEKDQLAGIIIGYSMAKELSVKG